MDRKKICLKTIYLKTEEGYIIGGLAENLSRIAIDSIIGETTNINGCVNLQIYEKSIDDDYSFFVKSIKLENKKNEVLSQDIINILVHEYNEHAWIFDKPAIIDSTYSVQECLIQDLKMAV